MRILKSAATYFALVFGTGLVLGTVRVLWAVPRFGTRIAELLEMPLMLVAIMLAARWTTPHVASGAGSAARLGIGIVALTLLLTAEVVLAVAVRGVSVTEALVDRDPVSGTVYYALLGLFAILPWLLGGRRSTMARD